MLDKGIWAVNIYKNGAKLDIIMDDYIPCREMEPCFAQSHSRELWVIILEKAWAKVHGTYERILGGNAAHAFRDLTGAPSFTIWTPRVTDDEYKQRPSQQDVQRLGAPKIQRTFMKKQELLEYDKSDYVMVASCRVEGDNGSSDVKDLGLVSDHAYTLLAVR